MADAGEFDALAYLARRSAEAAEAQGQGRAAADEVDKLQDVLDRLRRGELTLPKAIEIVGADRATLDALGFPAPRLDGWATPEGEAIFSAAREKAFRLASQTVLAAWRSGKVEWLRRLSSAAYAPFEQAAFVALAGVSAAFPLFDTADLARGLGFADGPAAVDLLAAHRKTADWPAHAVRKVAVHVRRLARKAA